MTAIVHPSFDSGAEAYLIAGSIALAGGSKDYIVPSSSPSSLSEQTAEIDETQFNDFAQTSSGTSLDVDIDPGEAFIFGAWVAFDTTQTISLDASTAGQQVYLGWDESQPNKPIVGTSSAFVAIDQKIPLFTFDTDGSGVTSTTDDRKIGRELDINAADLAGTFLSDDGSDNLTVNIGDGLENDGGDNIRIDEDFNFTFTTEIDFSAGLKSSNIASDTSFTVDIDADNDSTSETFSVTKDSGTPLLDVFEDGSMELPTDASGFFAGGSASSYFANRNSISFVNGNSSGSPTQIGQISFDFHGLTDTTRVELDGSDNVIDPPTDTLLGVHRAGVADSAQNFDYVARVRMKTGNTSNFVSGGSTSGKIDLEINNSSGVATEALTALGDDMSVTINNGPLVASGGDITDGTNTVYDLSAEHVPRARLDDQWDTTTVSTATTTANEEVVLADTSGGAFTLTLASADAVSGNRIEIADSGGAAGTNALTIATEGTETIDGSTSITISTNYGNTALVSDGTNWYTV